MKDIPFCKECGKDLEENEEKREGYENLYKCPNCNRKMTGFEWNLVNRYKEEVIQETKNEIIGKEED